jgi:hypothetical protein
MMDGRPVQLEMWCPVRGCGFEPRALRYCNYRPRKELRGLSFS